MNFMSLQPNSQKKKKKKKKKKKRGGLKGPQLLERGCWERGGDFFSRGGGEGGLGGVQFSHTK